MKTADYQPASIEPKWQAFWADDKTFAGPNPAPNAKPAPKYYVLDMFPYPSGAGLHIGHPEGYTATDALKRMKKSQGFNVLHPMGWDAFGLPTEQYAIKTGRPPAEVTEENIANFKKQLAQIGLTYDSDREVNTTDPAYYKWTQWIFVQLFKHGLAYVEEKPVWYCPELGTVLANEEVLNTPEGPRSERGSFPVEKRPLRQWVLRITAYADKLIAGLKDLDWPDSTKRLQENWIGRSTGAEVDFQLDGLDEKLRVFTTRPDTLYGATYMVVSPEHPLLSKITIDDRRAEVEAYAEQAKRKSDLERAELAKEKTGVFTGGYAINPVNGAKIPVWVADYVLITYGTGAIMAVPAHDERDFEFAKTFGLEILPVIANENANPDEELTEAYTGDGALINSGDLNGLNVADAKAKITAELAAKKVGKEAVNYKLRDWLFSRQRYWGEPFPIMWLSPADYKRLMALDKDESELNNTLPIDPVTSIINGEARCAITVPTQDLPLTLPQVDSYQPTGTGESPLAKAVEWVNVWLNLKTGETRPRVIQQDGDEQLTERPGTDWAAATRETNTMPQWAGSCWYYLRYMDPKNPDFIIDPKIEEYWQAPDLYVGGAEHAVLHLLYARFWHLFLHDIGVLKTKEPFKKLFHQGIILGEDGEKMSKSRGNVVNPEFIIKDHGADAMRLYLMFLGPLEAMKPWNTDGIQGINRFLRNKVWRELLDDNGQPATKLCDTEDDADTARALHETIKKVTADYERLSFNTAISQMMICANQFAKAKTLNFASAKAFLQLLAPLAPHITEEIWERLGEAPSIANAPWPKHDESKLVKDTVKLMVQINGKLRGELEVAKDTAQPDILTAAKALDKVAPQLEGKTIVKEIYVPGRIVNLVVK
ncbi:leucine--tRNA ligase [Cerasicoccus arenae]|uniref:Leucine--tRNA ligase n=1 Tax=Cerasicoccus arenae TaxID=424488 RepID=A0A8J3DG01_9BACT|nr:leucine--tRNA ligase [Cerasicoccus arenae]MBK1859003.1 leucine--tRNA ligase [Cerasicoccus arenae]GHB94630.1 leucine--tRNA ligase [Cerasicoccus arenae]